MGVRRHICYVLLWDVTWRSAAKTALVALLLRAGEATMWRFQPLCRAHWPFVGELGRGGAGRADPFSGSVR